MTWIVVFSNRARKQAIKLPKSVQNSLQLLVNEIRQSGPLRGNWPNFGKLSPDEYHCHLKKGQPTYVALWRLEKGGVRLVEVVYVGTHEKAPY